MHVKTVLIRSAKVLSLLLAVALTVLFAQEFILCNADHNRERVKGFYAEKDNSLDVVLIGASEVYSDFAPGLAYQNYGFTSYLNATQSNSILTTKTQLKELLKHQNPKMILIELNSVVYASDEDVVKEANIRNYIDNVPLNGNKLDFIGGYASPDEAAEYVFPIIKYHDTWKNIEENIPMISAIASGGFRGYNYLKGMKNETGIFVSKQRLMNDAVAELSEGKELTALSENSLRELLQFCRDENLTNVAFVRFPHLVVRRTYDRSERGITAGNIVREYGYDFLNFEQQCDQIGFDYEKDFYNLDHLNIYGQQKFTDYLCNILVNNYGVTPSTLDDQGKKEWQDAVNYYNAYYGYSDAQIKKNNTVELDEVVINDSEFKSYLQ